MRGVLIFVILFTSCFVQMVPTADSATIGKKSNTGESPRGFSELSSYYSQSEPNPNSAQSPGASKYVFDYNVVPQNEKSSVKQSKEILDTESDITTDTSTTELDIICVSVPIKQTSEDEKFDGEDDSKKQDLSRENESIKNIQEVNNADSQDGDEGDNQDQEESSELQNNNNKNQNGNKFDALEQRSSETSDDEQSQEKFEPKENSSSESQGNKENDKNHEYVRKNKNKIARQPASKFSKKGQEQRSEETAVNDTRKQSHENNDTKEDRGSESQEHEENDKSYNLRKRKQESTRELISKFYRQKISKIPNEDNERNKEANRDDEFWRALMLAID